MTARGRSGSGDAFRFRGVALVTALALLTILAVLATCFAVLLMIEIESSRVAQGRVQSDMMAQSGLQHAQSILREGRDDHPGWDTIGAAGQGGIGGNGLSKWLYARSKDGVVVGRYMVEIEDEAGKINVNAVSATSAAMQNQGVGTFEILLGDGKGSGLPLNVESARRVVQYRYGADGKPGRAAVDDNLTWARYQSDEIDNNGNGLIDEPGEGLDEPEEYMPNALRGDDRVFMSIEEMGEVAKTGARMSDAQRIELKRMATVRSKERAEFWDERTKKWESKLNINAADKSQIADMLIRANTDGQFEPSSRDVQQLAANMVDYRDQNHVLTTAGTEYGVEAVCFNEVRAYDASYFRETDWSGWLQYITDPEITHILCYNYFYGAEWFYNCYASVAKRWRVDSASQVGATQARIRLKLPADQTMPTASRFKAFLACDTKWQRDFWKGGSIDIYGTTGNKNFTVAGNPETSNRELIINCAAADFPLVQSAVGSGTVILHTWWSHGGAVWCEKPEQNETYFFHPPRGFPVNLYYQIFSMTGVDCPKWRNRVMDMDGDVTKYSETPITRGGIWYKDKHAVKPNAAGYTPMTITSSKQCGPGLMNNLSDSTALLRSDIVELINISDHPISLRNWSVVVNTGKDAWNLATIDTARRYNEEQNQRYDDPNPTIKPGGHFYLTNNREIFSLENAAGKNEYGGDRSETIPVYELPSESWGILYKVKDSDDSWIHVEGANWYEDQMRDEMIECVVTRQFSSSEESSDGHMYYVWNSTKDGLCMPGSWPVASVRKGDYIRIVGLPRQGGFVSFTLKNEYNQVVARTLEYGSLDAGQYGYSTQKYDPTHYTWKATQYPTISGQEQFAKNKVEMKMSFAQPHIKNNDYVSAAELQNVRRAKDWENVGSMDANVTRRALQAIDKYVTVSGVRLDPEEEGAHVGGWKPAFGTVRSGTANSVSLDDAQWTPGMWSGQKLRVMTGTMAGEEFAITNSSANTIGIAGYSTANGKAMKLLAGDVVAVGPGYVTPMYYSCTDADEGEWEWKNKDLVSGIYGVYLFGLNDSIVTTEFLEENWNAEMEVFAYNFRTRAYDQLPLDGDNGGMFYRKRGTSQRFRYGKNDGVYCGQIGADHISEFHGVRLKVVPHSTKQKQCSGFAWFDYAYLAPGMSEGKININTAGVAALCGLKGITKQMAQDIVDGVKGDGSKGAKPYREAADILNVRGVEPNVFSAICNLITVRGEQYRVKVVGQALKSAGESFDEKRGDRILAESRMDMVVERGVGK